MLTDVSLTLHHAPRTDLLADGLADVLSTPLEDPFAEEVVVVPAKGIERWLTQRLSHRLGTGDRGGDGVCAGVRFMAPSSLVSLLLGRERDDPWAPDQLTWPLLRVIDASVGDAGFEALARHLGHGGTDAWDDLRRARRFSVARRLAGLFSSYAVQRPRVITDWREGRDTDGAGKPLDADLLWQAELWRRLVAEVDALPPDVRHTETLTQLRAGGGGLDLPPRLSLFGHTRIPVTEVELLRAVAETREVHLWLPQASDSLWQALAPAAAEGPVRRTEDTSARLVTHPLLASLGRDSRELRRTLGTLDTETIAEAVTDGSATEPSTLLGWLQHDLRANAAADTATRAGRVPDPDDLSVQVHACHGATRQVDVLREVLVGLLEDDPSLQPRDILVMCPDIESYAPLMSAGFGLAEVAPAEAGHPGHQLRVRLADRSLGATNPLLGLAATVVELVTGRLTATEVLDLAAAAPVRARFGFTDDHLERISGWVREAQIRWGHDATHRADFGLLLDSNTWLTGMRRVLLGAAVSGLDHRVVGATLPLDDVGDGDLETLGRFTEFLDRLHTFMSRVRSASTVTDWTGALSDLVDQVTSTPHDEAWQQAQFDREMTQVATAPGASDTPMRQADVRALLAHRLRPRPTRSNFRTGTLTVCTLVPMRSVPHRVVALVGLDDGTFPRSTQVDGDDVLARRPCTGERDARSEDRQLLLDAIGAATQTLVVTYTGRGEHTGAVHPPAVPLGELLDALDRTAATPVRDQVLVPHPLQPYDEANLVPGALRRTGPFTFDRAALVGAMAARDPQPLDPVLIDAPLKAAPDDTPPGSVPTVELADLHDFLAHPVRSFLRSRLRITTPLGVDDYDDSVPITLNGLERWSVGNRLVHDVLNGADPQSAMYAEQMRGLLPPSQLGVGVLTEVVGNVRPLVTYATTLRQGTARTLDVDIDLGDCRLTGTVSGVFGNNAVSVTYSTLGPKQRLAGWLDALALAAGHPDENWTVHSIGKFRSGGKVAMVKPIGEPEARELLRDLVELWRLGRREPLPLPLKTSLAWAEEFQHRINGRDSDPDQRAATEWFTPPFNDSGFPREDTDAWHVRAYGTDPAYDLLTSELRTDEGAAPVPGLKDSDPPAHRLGHYAWRLWGPLLSGDREIVRGI